MKLEIEEYWYSDPNGGQDIKLSLEFSIEPVDLGFKKRMKQVLDYILYGEDLHLWKICAPEKVKEYENKCREEAKRITYDGTSTYGT